MAVTTTTKKPRPTLPTLEKRVGYLALMMLGVGIMLLAIGVEGTSSNTMARIAGLSFVTLGIALLVVAGGLDLHRRAFSSRGIEAEEHAAPQQAADTPVDELSEAEKALINMLRTNDVPPDAIAEAIREVLERRMGR